MLNEIGVIGNPEILSDSYIPPNLYSRDGQIQELQACLAPALKRLKPLHAWLYGDPGSGKTSSSKYVLDRLQEETSIEGVYIDCWRKNSFYAILDAILTELRVLCPEERITNRKLDELQKHIQDTPFIVILDEIDQVPSAERNAVIYNLSTLGNVGLICIGKSRHSLIGLDDRVQSRLSAQQIEFSPYTVDDLCQILRDRAERALVPDSWSRKTLERIAELAEGDARIAIQTLRSAAHYAERDYSKFIETRHIEKGFNGTRDLKKIYTLKSLSEHHQLLYVLIKERKEILSKELRRLYLRQCKEKKLEPVASRTFEHYLLQMVRMSLLSRKQARVRGRIFVYSPGS